MLSWKESTVQVLFLHRTAPSLPPHAKEHCPNTSSWALSGLVLWPRFPGHLGTPWLVQPLSASTSRSFIRSHIALLCLCDWYILQERWHYAKQPHSCHVWIFALNNCMAWSQTNACHPWDTKGKEDIFSGTTELHIAWTWWRWRHWRCPTAPLLHSRRVLFCINIQSQKCF